MKKFILILLVICMCKLSAQQNSQSYGLYGGYNGNFQYSDFNKIPNIPNCCPKFDNGFGNGFNLGFLFEHKLSSDLWFGSRIGIMTLDGDLKKNEHTTISLNNHDADGVFEHKIESRFINLGLEPSLIYNLYEGLKFSGGIRLGLNLTKHFSQVETLIDPAGVGTFYDSYGNDSHSRIRNNFSGDIPNANMFQLSLFGSFSYELPLNKSKNLRLAPELSYYFPLTQVAQNIDWKVASIRVGFALKYSYIPTIKKIEIFNKENRIDTVKILSDIVADSKIKIGVENVNTSKNESDTEIITTTFVKRTDTIFVKKIYNLKGNITAVGIDSIGREIQDPFFTIEEFVTNHHVPLLNYIFFDDGVEVLPDKYTLPKPNEVSNNKVENLETQSTLDIYHNVLNIIATRMNNNSKASITLIGCNSNIGNEKSNSDLSQKRAETVRDFFVNNWKINPKRIKIERMNLPAKPSTPYDEPIKIQENRRVEIYSDDYKILEPVLIENIVERKANPPIARFKAKATSEAGLKKWQIKAYQNSNEMNKFDTSGKSNIPDKIDWFFEKYQKIIPKTPEAVIYSLELEDIKGNKKVIESKTLPINEISIQKKRIEKVDDYEIDAFSLILFDFDNASIGEKNNNIINSISARIKPESIVEIKGYTDKTGNLDYNKELSRRRALATKNALKKQNANAIGVGDENLLYDNDSPEGRFYCRTVQVIVKTKVK